MADADITRPVVLVTGPTRGLGQALVETLSSRPAPPTLVLLARSAGALARVAGAARSAGAEVHEVLADLSDLRSVARACGQVGDAVAGGELPPLTAVVANAGLQHVDAVHRSAQGYEETFAVNVLAQHALLGGLRASLAPGAHLVLLGSCTHRGRWQSYGLVPSPVWRDPADLARPDHGPAGLRAGGRAYATSKLALVTIAHRWADELAGRQRVNVYDPGLMPGTGLARHLPSYQRWTWGNVMPAMRVLPGVASTAASARHCAALALGERHPRLHGGYVELGRLTTPTAATFNRSRQERLWQVCDELTEVETAA